MVAIVCPSHETLLQYSLGTLFGEKQDALDSHLDSCPDCQATIVTLDDSDDPVISRLRMPLSSESVLAEPQLQEALAAAMAMPVPKPTAEEDPGTRGKPILDVPEMLGECRVLEELGHGGMGRVYKALHTKLDRIVAVKVLPRGRMGDQQAITRFEREMKAIGRLAHPNIVQAFDAREIDGTPILIMEFVDGLDLAEIVSRTGPLSVAEACELMRQTAEALQCAHRHGLVHRDIKPSNIMLARSGEVKLLDLGLARFCAEATADEEMTSTGQAMGTADYIAPEQAADSRTVDIRADLYSLGCTLYKLLSGLAPFSGPEYHGTLDKINAHVHQPAPSIRHAVGDVPERLATIVDRLLAKNPADRFGTPAELAEALAPWCGNADLPALLRRAEASGSAPLSRGENQREDRTLPKPLAASPRWKSIIRLAVLLLLLLGGIGYSLGILITIKRDGKETTIEVPEGSHTTIDSASNVTVTLADKLQGTVVEQQAFIIGSSPYWQTLADMVRRKGMTVPKSFNCNYDEWLPLAKGHLLLVETHAGIPIVSLPALDKVYPGASEGLKSPKGIATISNTKIAFVDFSQLLNGTIVDSATVVSLKSQAFVIGNSPYWQTLTDMARQKGFTVGRSFNGNYDELLPLAKGHLLLIETHDGIPIVPLPVLDKFYPGASDGLKAPDGVATVGTTRIVFVDFSRLSGWF